MRIIMWIPQCLLIVWLTVCRISTVAEAFAFPAAFPEGEGPDGTRYKTAYRCEDEELSIQCEPAETIQVIRANYGRFSIAICNKHGETDWSVNCMSPRTTRVLQNRCDGKKTCRMPVNSEVFGDPCPGTNKYVEVHYACSPQFTTTTRRPMPPWFLEGGADELWNNGGAFAPSSTQAERTPTAQTTTTQQLTDPTSPKKPESIVGIRKPILVTEPTTPVRIPITTPKPTTTSTTSSTTTTTTEATTIETETPVEESSDVEPDFGTGKDEGFEVQVIVSDIPLESDTLCRPNFARNLHWNWTRPGEEAIVPCPNGATGLARWLCSNAAEWVGPGPDLTDCKSLEMTNLEERVRNEDAESVLSSSLATLTSSSTLYGGDLESSVAIMRTVANRIQYLLQTKPRSFHNKESYIQQVFQNMLRAASNLLGAEAAWFDLHSLQRMKIATSLLLSLEEHAFLLAQVTNAEETIEEAAANILMSISVQSPPHIRENGTRFPLTDSVIFDDFSDSLRIPRSALKENAQARSKAVFFAYKNLHDLLSQGDITVADGKNHNYELNSHVVSATVGTPGRHVQLSADSVRLRLRHLRPNMSSPACVYWDFELNSWLDHGCTVVASGHDFTDCECDHLTNFALAMLRDTGVVGTEMAGSAMLTLEIVTYCAVVLAVVFVVLVGVKYRSKIAHLFKKFCHGDEKKGEPTNNETVTACPKSQSFYTGINLMRNGGPANNTVKTGTMSTMIDNNRLSQYMLQQRPSDYGGHTPTLFVNTGNGSMATLPLPATQHAAQTFTTVTNQLIAQAAAGPPPQGNIIMNPYMVDEEDDGLARTLRLRDDVYMSPQLMNLTNTLRNKKKLCQGGHCTVNNGQAGYNDPTILPESEVVFRAVSPHGHVYWEIDPKRPRQTQSSEVSEEDECSSGGRHPSSDVTTSSRQSSSRYSDNHPLIPGSPPQLLVNPFLDLDRNDVRFSSLRMSNGSPGRVPTSTSSTVMPFGPRAGSARTPTRMRSNPNEEMVPEQLQQRVQIRDLRSIPVSVKSNEYILAKIQNHMGRGTPTDGRGTPMDRRSAIFNRSSPKQRKV